MNVASLSRREKEEMLTLLGERAIQGPRGGNSEAIRVSAKDEMKPRRGRSLAKRTPTTRRLTVLREDTRHWGEEPEGPRKADGLTEALERRQTDGH